MVGKNKKTWQAVWSGDKTSIADGECNTAEDNHS